MGASPLRAAAMGAAGADRSARRRIVDATRHTTPDHQTHWSCRAMRERAGGALAMSLKHGSYCAGCCWALMALLFVGGMMSLLWIAGLTIFVLLEKTLPAGEWVGRGRCLGAVRCLGRRWGLAGELGALVSRRSR